MFREKDRFAGRNINFKYNRFQNYSRIIKSRIIKLLKNKKVENMADKKDDSVEKFIKNKDMIKDLIESLRITHSKAYTSAADKHLYDKEKKRYVMSKLDDQKVKDDFAKTMTEAYEKGAMDYFSSNEKDGMKKHQLVKAYGGLTGDMAHKYVHTHGKKYTSKLHEGIRDELAEEVEKQLNVAAGAHLKESDKDKLIKHIKADGLVDSKLMRLQDALALYDIYDSNNKNINKDAIVEFYRRNNIPAPVYLKSDKKEYKKAA